MQRIKVKIMENNLIMFNSVTLAMRARDILGINNVFSRLIRTPMNLKNRSCGYSILVTSDFEKAVEILSRNGIAYIGTAAVDAE